MTKSELFKAAHKLAKETIQANDSYSATFALCLSFVYSNKEDFATEKEIRVRIPYSDKRARRDIKKYWDSKWDSENKVWVVSTKNVDKLKSEFGEYVEEGNNTTDNTVDSGVGFYMQNTKTNWNLVMKYGHDAIEKVS